MKPKKRISILISAFKEAGISQSRFAEIVGLSQVYIKKLKSSTSDDSRNLSLSAAIAISENTGVDCGWLMGEGDEFPILNNIGNIWNARLPNLLSKCKHVSNEISKKDILTKRLAVVERIIAEIKKELECK